MTGEVLRGERGSWTEIAAPFLSVSCRISTLHRVLRARYLEVLSRGVARWVWILFGGDSHQCCGNDPTLSRYLARRTRCRT